MSMHAGIFVPALISCTCCQSANSSRRRMQGTHRQLRHSLNQAFHFNTLNVHDNAANSNRGDREATLRWSHPTLSTGLQGYRKERPSVKTCGC
eukprot:scaffold41864_cov17-Tisochrysis_lutea.AAC.1